jgi:hypothetical protein
MQLMLVRVGIDLFREQLLENVVESCCGCNIDGFCEVLRLADRILEHLTKLVDLLWFGFQMKAGQLADVLELGD